ncbi:MAG: helix-hairpin-helix domain-containing protein [Firmicutes bacterium]|nr:helix-hairpin-helix domain-containing protein [Bacillota bacterium]
MPVKQKAVLLILVVLSIIQQGVKWTKTGQMTRSEVAVVQAAETVGQREGERHCSLVHVNSAGMAELQSLPGIGPIYAERIMIERRERPFVEKHDLLRVAGIGEKRLAQLSHLICLYYDDAPSE